MIAAYNAADPASSTWADPGKHVDGIVQRSGYHDLGGWTSPGGGTDHHGSNYFLTHQQRDEHSVACTQCHGDVTLTGRATGMSWDVNATQGTPVTARGTCTGACHSNGDGGPPAVLPYWAGGTWSTGNCGNCHPALPTSGMHAFHRNHGLDCTDCHPGAGTATHPDGAKTYIGSATMTPNTCQANTSPTCNGICHGTEHVNDCWP